MAATLDEARRAALFYQLGAELAAAGEADEARALLERVPAGSSHAGRARLQRARLQLRRGELAAGTAAAIARRATRAVVATDAARAIAGRGTWRAIGRARGRRCSELAAVTPAAAFARSRIELEDGRALPGLAEAPVAAFEAVAVATACAQGLSGSAAAAGGRHGPQRARGDRRAARRERRQRRDVRRGHALPRGERAR